MASTSIETDWLAAGDRLRELLLPLKPTVVRDVLVATDLAAAENLGQIVPAVHIIYQGDQVGDGRQGGKAKDVTQSWMVLLVHRNVAGLPSAGECLRQVMDAVTGKSFDKHVFMLATPPKPSHYQGASYLPVSFTIQLQFKGA